MWSLYCSVEFERSMKNWWRLTSRRARQQDAFTGLPVPSGTSDFLIVAFEVARQVVVDDEPDVRLVYPHAEGIRRHSNVHFPCNEQTLIAVPLLFAEAAVIDDVFNSMLLEMEGDLFHLCACSRIDDAGSAGMIFDVGFYELFTLVCRVDAEMQIIPRYTCAVDTCPFDVEELLDVLLDLLCCCGGQPTVVASGTSSFNTGMMFW